ncbi:MAG TPA: hypothetical protein VJ966_04570, partial [Actinomycetes bacterium]|nr:hypothetical protein [Actinomycetes bacterium]
VGLGLGRDHTTPTVDQPSPPVTSPAPPASARMPATFVASLDDRLQVVSSTTGKTVRTLASAPQAQFMVGLSPDRATAYSSQLGPVACNRPGVFRVPVGGGPPVRIVEGESASGPISTSADGSRLAYLTEVCGASDQVDLVLRDAAGALVRRWTVGPALGAARAIAASLSPDGRTIAVTLFDELDPIGVRLLDVAHDATFGDGRLIQAPDLGCKPVNAVFQPGTGRLVMFERCLPGDPQTDTTPPRFRLVSLDPASGRLLARGFAFDDHSGADLEISTMDFDRSGRYLLYSVGSADPADSQVARPQTGTWRYGGGRPIRVADDRRSSGGERITSIGPAW